MQEIVKVPVGPPYCKSLIYNIFQILHVLYESFLVFISHKISRVPVIRNIVQPFNSF